MVAQAVEHWDGRASECHRAARGSVELNVRAKRLGETAPLPVRLEPRDPLSDRPAHRVRAAFVPESLLDQCVGRPVAAIPLVRPGDRDDDDTRGGGDRHGTQQPLGPGRQHKEAGTGAAREQRERLALSLKRPLD